MCMHDRQVLASLGERYTLVFNELRVLQHLLNQMLGGQDHMDPNQLIPLTQKSRTAIGLWRFILVLTEYKLSLGLRTGRDIGYFTPSSLVTGVIEFDGSLKGCGWRLFENEQGPCIVAGAAALSSTLFPDGLFKSDYQNS